MTARLAFALCAVLCLAAHAAPAASDSDAITLHGTWRMAPDPEERGREVLDSPEQHDGGEVWLPGAIQRQGYGERPGPGSNWIGDLRPDEWARPEYDGYRRPGNFKMPFWLQPERVYVGPVWYEREIGIPRAWAGRRVTLHLERTHWVTEAWLDGRPLGKRESLSVPNEFPIGRIEPGTHTLTLRVDNRLAYGVGPNAHSVTDHTQTNWNGVIGDIELRAEPAVAIRRVRVEPETDERRASVAVVVANHAGEPSSAEIRLTAANDRAPGASASRTLRIPAGGEREASLTLDLGPDAALWTEFTPHPYTLDVEIETEHGVDTHRTWFGLREVGSDDGRITLNGRPIYLRGTLDCAIYPRTGYPPMDVAAWERVFSRVKAFGLNHVRYHSWCPPRAAFLAADRLGVYLQVEGPFWVNQGPELGLDQPIDEYVYEETDRILAEYGNHPSFVLMAYGNEPSGPGRGGVYLADWLEKYKAEDQRRLYTSAAGWPIIDESQFHVTYEPRIQRWGEGLNSTINSEPPSTRRDYRDFASGYEAPVVAHEIGQWCVFPNFDEMAKYTGHLKPKNFEIFRDLLAENGMAHLADEFLMASGRLQVMCYKEEIEAALRTPGFGGFQLLDLHDFPGQGTALVGVLDPFWDPKPYITAEEYRSFCGPITPLARFDGRAFESGETLEADIEVAQFGPRDLTDARVRWSLTREDGERLARGAFGPATMPAGELVRVGSIEAPLAADEPSKATLRVEVEGADAANAWDVWIYPAAAEIAPPPGVRVTRSLDEDAESHLEAGGTVLFLPDPSLVKGGVAFGFSPVFWNTAWTSGQAPHTLGILVDPGHPLFEHFPTPDHTDWQWWDLIGWPGAQAGAMVIDDLPVALDPLVRPIDTWFRSRPLAALFEARVGPGKLVVSTLDLQTDLDRRHAARQFRRSLMAYLASSGFDPEVEVEPAAVRDLFRPPTTMERLGASIGDASSAESGYEPVNAIDGDPSTMWHTRWTGGPAGHPHAITIELDEPVALTGLTYLPRQDGNPNGRIARYEVHTSRDGESWARAATGRFEPGASAKEIRFGSPREARYVRLTALDSQSGVPHTAIAELELRTR